jgi:hypothetical protein
MHVRLSCLSLLLLSGVAAAQLPPAAANGPAAPVADAAALQTISGQVRQYLLAPRGEVDGLLLTDGTQIAVPPHLQDALVASVKAGDTVSVNGERESASRFVARQIDDATTAARVVDRGPGAETPPEPPVADDEVAPATLSAHGVVSVLLSGPRGEVNGAVLDDGSVIRFAPRAGLYYADHLKTGSTISVSGFGVENKFGRVIEVQELRAD